MSTEHVKLTVSPAVTVGVEGEMPDTGPMVTVWSGKRRLIQYGCRASCGNQQ